MDDDLDSGLEAGSPEYVNEWIHLYRRAANGDRTAQERLLLPLEAPLRAYVRMRAGPELRAAESVSDVVQSVFRELLVDLDKVRIDEEGGLQGWALRTARYKIVNKVRRLRAQKRGNIRRQELPSWSRIDQTVADLFSRLPAPADVAVAAETHHLLDCALRTLPELHQRVIVLARMMELPHAQVARQLGRSPGATRILLMRALAGLAKALERAERNGGGRSDC